MNVREAMVLLEINIPIDKLNYKIIRKSYLKASLKYHPDKYRPSDSDHDSDHNRVHKFTKIVEAYDFLCEHTGIDKQKPEYNFDTLLEELITKFYPPNNTWTQIFIKTTIKNMLGSCEKFSYKIFEKLGKDKAMEVYEFMNSINDYGFINDSTMERLRSILKEKMKNNDNIVFLGPTLEDLLSDKIYKLDLSENIFYIPLWHNELYFDFNGVDLIVKIEPELKENIFIDHNNNIFCKRCIRLKDLYQNEEVVVELAGKKFKIASTEFKITKKSQIFKYESCGILKIDENDYFNNKHRSDIVFELHLII